MSVKTVIREFFAVEYEPEAPLKRPTPQNAAYSAQLLEADRRATLRADLLRQRRETKETLAGIDLMLDELDAQDCLDRVS